MVTAFFLVGAAGFEPATPWSQRMWETFPLVPLYALKSPFYCILGTGKVCHIPLCGIYFPLEVCTFVCTNNWFNSYLLFLRFFLNLLCLALFMHLLTFSHCKGGQYLVLSLGAVNGLPQYSQLLTFPPTIASDINQ